MLAWDGTELEASDTTANAGFFGRHTGTHGQAGFPTLRLSALAECGTRALVDAVFGPLSWHEKAQAAVLCRALHPEMLLLADRGSDSYELMSQAARTGAHLLWRIQRHRVLPVIEELPDGSYLSMVTDTSSRPKLKSWTRRRQAPPPQITGVAVRVIEATIAVTDQHGTATTSLLRLVTTLLDHQRYPATDLAALYHERWQVETTYFGLKVTLRGTGRVLRSGWPHDVGQELYGLLIVYQAARRIATQAATDTGIDPDRISLTVTLRTARHTVINHKPAPLSPPDATPKIRAAILHPRELGPIRRTTRILPRRVKRTISPFAYNKTRKNKPINKAVISYTIRPPTTPLTTSQDP